MWKKHIHEICQKSRAKFKQNSTPQLYKSTRNNRLAVHMGNDIGKREVNNTNELKKAAAPTTTTAPNSTKTIIFATQNRVVLLELANTNTHTQRHGRWWCACACWPLSFMTVALLGYRRRAEACECSAKNSRAKSLLARLSTIQLTNDCFGICFVWLAAWSILLCVLGA